MDSIVKWGGGGVFILFIIFIGLRMRSNETVNSYPQRFTIRTVAGEPVIYSGNTEEHPFLIKVVGQFKNGLARVEPAATQEAMALITVGENRIYWWDNKFWDCPTASTNREVTMELPLPKNKRPAWLLENRNTITKTEWLEIMQSMRMEPTE